MRTEPGVPGPAKLCFQATEPPPPLCRSCSLLLTVAAVAEGVSVSGFQHWRGDRLVSSRRGEIKRRRVGCVPGSLAAGWRQSSSVLRYY